ncbi:sigma-70 family RNA polymerase sigma factor [Paraburkholderia madseniana]|uniref:Sigma-70 family RNA polymerase sigma factor n=1 Tax=Paraburkholderia madseniana TaxID=2599607 RepID=A0A6N6W4Q3_9BURK|nr:RNA polymerase sigma factor [Paraburkholderia madseniana]KAE8754878.1 sigma-70 family RNA polymerase sigma factor [Paraburkholderia madseniana]
MISTSIGALTATDLAERDRVLAKLFREHQRRLFQFIFKRVRDVYEATELTQQAFVEACHGFGTFRGESECATWLYGIAVNLIRNHVNRSPSRRYDFCGDETIELMESPQGDPFDHVSTKQKATHMQHGLDGLPDDLRKTLLMVTIEDRSYEDVAVELAIPVGTVRSRVSRSRVMLRERLESRAVVAQGA